MSSTTNENSLLHKQFKSAFESIQQANPSKWHIHETQVSKKVVQFQVTETKSIHDISPTFNKSLKKATLVHSLALRILFL